MNYHFHPSPRPSSLELLTDEQLLNIYELAVQAKASSDFIQIIENVLSNRNIDATIESTNEQTGITNTTNDQHDNPC